MEFMGLLDGQSVSFRVVRWVLGEAEIFATADRRRKLVPALRLYVRPEDKPIGAAYWDVTATTSISRLRPYLDRPDLRDLEFTFLRHGVAPAGRDEIRVNGAAA